MMTWKLPSPKKFKVDNKLIAMEAMLSAIWTSVEEIKDAVEYQYVCPSGKVQSFSAIEYKQE